MTGRALPPSSRFAGDDGSADPSLLAALAAHPPGGRAGEGVVAALAAVRVLVPVVASLDHAGTTPEGLVVDKEASAGVVAVRTPDGRTGLPVFSSTATLAAWRADARPVPAGTPQAAAACLAEGWDVLVLDPAGPCAAVVSAPAVRALADGSPWRPAVDDAGVDPVLRGAVRTGLQGLAGVVAADVEPGRTAEVAVVLELVPGLDRARLDAVLGRVQAALAAVPALAAADSVELRVRAARAGGA